MQREGTSNHRWSKTALLGGELAKRAPEVNETMRSNSLRLAQVQTNFEENQHSKNTKINVPSTYGLPLEGEWCQDRFSTDLSSGIWGSGFGLALRPECFVAGITLSRRLRRLTECLGMRPGSAVEDRDFIRED